MLKVVRVGAGTVRLRTIAAVGVCTTLVSAAAGCGGSAGPATKPASTAITATSPATPAAPGTPTKRYDRAMQTLGAELSSSLQRAGDTELASAGKAQEAEKDVKALEGARIALRAAAAQLARIVAPAPAPARSATALLLKGVEEYAEELGGVIDSLDAGGAPVAVLQRIFQLKGVLDMQRASIELERKGFDIVG